ncbi:MAG: hypothetical protein AMXMBFR33_49560 [Candidatus Xenobia bacterium]|jgi:antitoxin (DNA-binding transcriptional repressor) of toxin-antitoxin stability system
MEKIGVRDLKNNLSACLRRVAAGEVILVTDHGRVVAELRQPSSVPPGFEDYPPTFWEKVARGEIKLAPQRNQPGFLASLPGGEPHPSGTAQRLLDEDRDEG